MALSESQEHILDAAMSCIVRDGIEGTSLRNVAREADVSLGLLSYHFDDKRSLIVAAFERATDRLLASSVESLDGIEDPAERVKAFIRGAFRGEYLEPDYLALRTSLWAVSRIDPLIRDVEASLTRRYADRMGALVAAACTALDEGAVVDRVTDVIINQNGLWLHWARYQNEADLERGLRRCEAIALGDAA
ncbi:MAG: TetR family transcriptional regulator [Actinomycetota bacterium]